MKNIILILLVVLSFKTQAQNKPCPVTGGSNRRSDQFSDSLKNRNDSALQFQNLPIGQILMTGNDINRFTYSQYVRVHGIITDVKRGGSELCNCHSKNKLDLDIHIVLSDSTGNGKIICEVNRYTQASNPLLSYQNVHSMIGRVVYIYGWLFFDAEHLQNATNTCGSCTSVWRSTCWEIHPVMRLQILK